MAITSVGYDGTINEVQWASMISKVGMAAYGVADVPSWKVTAVAGVDRTVSIAAGVGWGYGVYDVSDANVTIQLDTVSSGSRWDLIVARRDWTGTGGVTTFAKVNGGTGKVIPGRTTGPGVVDEQPIALVQIIAGQSQPGTIVDLRCWSSNGGMAAASEEALAYLKVPGAMITVGTQIWTATIDPLSGLVNWNGTSSIGGSWTSGTVAPGWTILSPVAVRSCAGGTMLHVKGEVRWDRTGSPREGWSIVQFPSGLRPSEHCFVPGWHWEYQEAHNVVYFPDGHVRVGPKPVYDIIQFNGVVPN